MRVPRTTTDTSHPVREINTYIHLVYIYVVCTYQNVRYLVYLVPDIMLATDTRFWAGYNARLHINMETNRSLC